MISKERSSHAEIRVPLPGGVEELQEDEDSVVGDAEYVDDPLRVAAFT